MRVQLALRERLGWGDFFLRTHTNPEYSLPKIRRMFCLRLIFHQSGGHFPLPAASLLSSRSAHTNEAKSILECNIVAHV